MGKKIKAWVVIISISIVTAFPAQGADSRLFLKEGKKFALARNAKFIHMGFKEFVQTAVNSNLLLKSSAHKRAASIHNYEIAKGAYDFTMFTESEYADTEDDINSGNYKIGIEKKFTSGTEISVFGADQYTEGNTYSITSSLNPDETVTFTNIHDGDLNFTVVQHLLKGGWWFDEGSSLRVSRLQAEAAIASDWEAVNNTVYDALVLFLDLRYAFEKYVIEKEDKTFSEKLLTLANRKVAAGILSGLEKLRTEADLLQKKETLLNQEEDISRKQADLRKTLNLPAYVWVIPFLDEVEIPIPIFDKTFEMARYSSGELLSANAQKKAAEIQLRAARWRMLPTFDASAQYNINLYGDSSFNSDYDEKADWSMGLSFAYPIGNRVGENTYKASFEAMKIAEIEYETKVLNLREHLRNLYDRHDTLNLLIASLEERIKLANRRIDIEKVKYLQGVSKFIELQESQNEKVSIEDSLKESRMDLIKTKMNILKAAGMLPETILSVGDYRMFSLDKIR